MFYVTDNDAAQRLDGKKYINIKPQTFSLLYSVGYDSGIHKNC